MRPLNGVWSRLRFIQSVQQYVLFPFLGSAALRRDSVVSVLLCCTLMFQRRELHLQLLRTCIAFGLGGHERIIYSLGVGQLCSAAALDPLHFPACFLQLRPDGV